MIDGKDLESDASIAGRGTVERANEYIPWTSRTQAEIKSAGTPPLEYDIDMLAERYSGPSILFGDSGAMKSWQGVEECRCIATGQPLFGKFAVRPRPFAVYVNIDAPPYNFDRRVSMIVESIPNFIVFNVEKFSLEHFERDVLQRFPGAWVVVDCFADTFFPDPREEQGAAMRRFIRSLRMLYAKYECNGTIIDHSRRQKPGDPSSTERFYGSGQKKAAIRAMRYAERLRRKDDRPNSLRVKISCEKPGEVPLWEPFLVTFTWTDENFTTTYGGRFDEATARGEAALQHRTIIEQYMDPNEHLDGVTAAHLVKMSKLAKKQVLAALKTRGIERVGDGRNTRYKLIEPMVEQPDE